MKRRKQEPIPGPIGYRDGRPVFVVKVDGLAASFVCPRCKATNKHGLGPDGQSYGHRQAHCECWRPGGYWLEAPPPLKVLPARKKSAPLLSTPRKCSHTH
jgi:hypothetical protein